MKITDNQDYKIVKIADFLQVQLIDGTHLPKQTKLIMEDDLEYRGYIKCTATIEFFIETDQIDIKSPNVAGNP